MVKIELDISKRFAIFSVVFLLVIGLFAVSYAGNGQFNLPLGWILDNNGKSVDNDNNGVIDNSDKLTGLTAADLNAAGTGGSVACTNVVSSGSSGLYGGMCCAIDSNGKISCIYADQSGLGSFKDNGEGGSSSIVTTTLNYREFTCNGDIICYPDKLTADKICKDRYGTNSTSFETSYITQAADGAKWTGSSWTTYSYFYDTQVGYSTINIGTLTCVNP